MNLFDFYGEGVGIVLERICGVTELYQNILGRTLPEKNEWRVTDHVEKKCKLAEPLEKRSSGSLTGSLSVQTRFMLKT